MTKQILIVFTLFFLNTISSAQISSYFVKGKVINAQTKQPMQGASVFAENTTLGTATDQDGNFVLELPIGGYSLVVTYTGFNTQSIRISNTESNKIDIEMTVKEKSLEEVAVVSTGETKNGLEKYGNFFMEEFIGKSKNSGLSKLKNPESLKFYFSKRKNRLKVLSSEPLIIENNALGYNIKYEMDSFVHEYNTDITIYTGYPLFEEMQSTSEDQKIKWKSARESAYKGSILHFMRSLYNMELEEEGFQIQLMVNINGKDSALKVKDYYQALNYNQIDSTSPVVIKPNQNKIGIIYINEKPEEGYLSENKEVPAGFQFSTISFLPNKSLSIEENGFYYEQNDFLINDYWEWNRMADALPYDYK
jgi:hypothetical protein